MLLMVSECGAGYYKNSMTPPRCEMCTANTIKTTVGDATDCDADPPCDGIKTIPNDKHTACGNFTNIHLSTESL